MRRNLAFGLAWLVAAIAAAVIAWQGVGLVSDQVTDDRPATLSGSDIDSALAAGTTTTTAGGTAPTTAPGPATSTPSTTTTTAPAARTETETIRTSRGTAALVFSPEGVTQSWATPDPGYQVESRPGDRNGWRVEFEGDDGRSRIDAWWDDGPQYRVQDDGTESGSSGHGGDD